MIEQLWKMHLTRPFPRALAGEEVDGEDLVLLDSLAAGCISTFLGGKGVHLLDDKRLKVLNGCAQSLRSICPQLPSDHRLHFDTLREMSERVINICEKGAK